MRRLMPSMQASLNLLAPEISRDGIDRQPWALETAVYQEEKQYMWTRAEDLVGAYLSEVSHAALDQRDSLWMMIPS